MKITVLFLFLSFTTQLYAQKFEIGINVGRSSNSVPKDVHDKFNDKDFERTISKVMALKCAYVVPKWRMGISVEQVGISYHYHGSEYEQPTYVNIAYGWVGNQIPRIIEINEKVIVAKNALPIRLFIDRKIAMRKFELYTGASFGYVFLSEISPRTRGDIAPFWFTGYGHGIVAGLQAGATYSVTKRLGINAEIYSGQMWSKHERFGKYNTVLSSATLGVRYRL